jgi:hypothetical protein
VLGLTQSIALIYCQVKAYKDAEYVVHPRKIIMSILSLEMLSAFRFTIIGLVYIVTTGNLEYTPYKNRDFGILPFNCKLEGTFSYMLLILNILWNCCWSYDLYLCVKKPMSYSENFFPTYQKLTYSIGIICAVVAFFFSTLNESKSHNAICIMNKGPLYLLFVVLPLIISFIINLSINLKYGRDSYLRKFNKNYERFKLIFKVQRFYFITWTLTMLICVSYTSFHTTVLVIQPTCIVRIIKK